MLSAILDTLVCLIHAPLRECWTVKIVVAVAPVTDRLYVPVRVVHRAQHAK